jgi:hypothetical protein
MQLCLNISSNEAIDIVIVYIVVPPSMVKASTSNDRRGNNKYNYASINGQNSNK